MAVGDIVSKANAKKSVCMAAALNAANGAPAAQGDGVPAYPTNQIVADDGHCYTACPAMSSTLSVKVVGTSALATLWGYLAAADDWFPIADVNDGQAITGNYSERFLDLGHYDELYLEVTPTSATVDAWLTTSRTVAY